ncbi:hypothetical protein NEOLI_005376 [Neolecta irregularis DAH-3]|uniref:Uncharacterized protein n=1 Tax=Neolecta irregularis (strain DAH-3) TaxID=1198029 RepID=A0A1U7LJD2_NEOID|nr:hypothetical protein NEOLI_005376 [Neolecta irregularis DAH-3]|eukprot:OLL22776.1 hypothetical protein NEOLI_005376 [Neolecta irregularis DAH-3]
MLRGDEDRAFDLVVEFHVGKVQDKLQEMASPLDRSPLIPPRSKYTTQTRSSSAPAAATKASSPSSRAQSQNTASSTPPSPSSSSAQTDSARKRRKRGNATPPAKATSKSSKIPSTAQKHFSK